MAKHVLFPKGIMKKFPERYSQENKKPENIPVICKIFNPYGAGTWYLTEYDEENEIFFGLCCIHEAELGYVSKEELETCRVGFGWPLERDLYLGNISLAKAMEIEGVKR